jgi:hypothetical protein
MPVFDSLDLWATDPTWWEEFQRRLHGARDLARNVPLLHVTGMHAVVPSDAFPEPEYVIRPGSDLENEHRLERVYGLQPAVICHPGRVGRAGGVVIALSPEDDHHHAGVAIYTGLYRQLHHVSAVCGPPDRTLDYVGNSNLAFGPSLCFMIPPWRQLPQITPPRHTWWSRVWGRVWGRVLQAADWFAWWFGRRVLLQRWRVALATLIAAYFRQPDEWWNGKPERSDPDGVFQHFSDNPHAWTFEVRIHCNVPLSHVKQWCCSTEAWDDLLREITQIPLAAEEDNPFMKFMKACLVLGVGPSYVSRMEEWVRNGCRR